jgi:hypothetical protein
MDAAASAERATHAANEATRAILEDITGEKNGKRKMEKNVV